MKVNRIIVALAAVAVCACSVKTETVPVAGTTGEELFSLSVNVPVVSTKVSTGNDAAVTSCQIFVFRENGVLEAASYGSSSEAVLRVTRGAKKVAVLVNCAEVTGSVNFDNLQSKALALSDNAPSSVQMYGTQPLSLSSDADVTVEVTRLVAKVGIKDIENALELAQYSGQTMTVTRIFLENVVGNRQVAYMPTTTLWYNKGGFVSSDCPALLADSMGTVIAAGGKLTANRYFYCYPNGGTTPTRLVVELAIGSETWYYPITIDSVVANTYYLIEGLKITRIGTKNPDETIDIDSASFSISVKDWTLSSVSTVTI